MCVCVGYSCVMNQWHLECDCTQCAVFVPVFHIDVMQGAGSSRIYVDCISNVMAPVQKTDFIFQRNERVHLNRRGSDFSRLLAAELCASAVVMLDISCSEVVRRILVTHTSRQFSLHFPPMRHRVPTHFNCTLLQLHGATIQQTII